MDQFDDHNLDNRINEPCWFYNNGGCRFKNGMPKSQSDCKYLHVYRRNVMRPLHLKSSKPCIKYNLYGKCSWGDNCKYSHKKLDEVEDCVHFARKIVTPPDVSSRSNTITEHLHILEYKQQHIIDDITKLKTNIEKLKSSGEIKSRLNIIEYRQNELSRELTRFSGNSSIQTRSGICPPPGL